MNMHQVVQPRSSTNGYGRRKGEKDSVIRSDNKFQAERANSKRSSFGKGGTFVAPSRDRLIYLTTCLIGHPVEVQVLDGSVFSGIFHSANADDFEIVLKMAHLIKDGSEGQSNIWSFPSKPSTRTFVVQAKDLVQVIAKGVPVTRDGLANDFQYEKHPELMTDSHISQSRYVEGAKELERWVPDENDPGCPELENIFDGPWNRQWDQFEVNETLFGVTSSFNEELYTTKLVRGPQVKELEREAARIAREIEGENTIDLHQAEERGIQLVANLELDEETRYSSVFRGPDDSGYDETEDMLDSRNDETFGEIPDYVVSKPLMDIHAGRPGEGIQALPISSSGGEVQSSITSVSWDVNHSAEDNGQIVLSEQFPNQSSVISASRIQESQFIGYSQSSSIPNEDNEQQLDLDQNKASKVEAFDPSLATLKDQEKTSTQNELSEGALPPKTQATPTSAPRPSSSASSTSDRGGVTSTSANRGLTSSSSVGSLSSEKSTLNPNAKDFKLNPNAKSFMPTVRPSSPVADSPFYYPPNVASSQMHGMPIGIGIGPFVPQQPVMFNPQAVQMPQAYYHPNATQYGQQMMYGQQPRPVVYMPYHTDMPYNGREF